MSNYQAEKIFRSGTIPKMDDARPRVESIDMDFGLHPVGLILD